MVLHLRVILQGQFGIFLNILLSFHFLTNKSHFPHHFLAPSSLCRDSSSSSEVKEILKYPLNNKERNREKILLCSGLRRKRKMKDSYLVFLFILSSIVCSFSSSSSSSYNHIQNPPVLSFEEGYSELFGGDNLMILRDGKTVHLSLDKRTGSGFISQDLYLHGFFSASIKLPAEYTAGVVVAFYMSNGDMFERNHDELDFEFLGNIRGKNWRIQTNVYGNGSTNVGREERYGLWFDPSEDFHQYSILWTENQIIFYIDNIPIREIQRSESMGGDFPSKPMSLYATIWDGSTWATNGGRYKLNYKYAPYIAEFSDLVLHGCTVDPIEQSHHCDNTNNADLDTEKSIIEFISSQQRSKMMMFRKKYLMYSYCYDHMRYKSPPLECVINPQEAERLRRFDPVTFGNGLTRNNGKRHRRNRSSRTEAVISTLETLITL